MHLDHWCPPINHRTTTVNIPLLAVAEETNSKLLYFVETLNRIPALNYIVHVFDPFQQIWVFVSNNNNNNVSYKWQYVWLF